MFLQQCVSDHVLTRVHASIPLTTEKLTVKLSHFSGLSLGDGRLFPDNIPNDNPYKTSDTHQEQR